MRPVTTLAPPATASPPPGRGAQEAVADPFAAILDTHQARTAVAEGHSPKRPIGAPDQPPTTPVAHDAGAQPEGRANAQDALETAPAAAPAAPGGPVVDPLPAAIAAAVALPAPPVPAALVATPSGAVPGAPAPATTPAPGGPPVLFVPAPPAPGAPLAGTPVSGIPVPGAPGAPGLPGAAAPATPGTPPTPPDGRVPADVPVRASGVGAQPAASDPAPATAPGATTSAGTPAPSRPAAAEPADMPASGAADTAPGDGQHAAAPAPAPASAPPAAAAPAPAVPQASTPTALAAPVAPSARDGVALQQAAETVRLTVRAAADQGITRVRIVLRPVELGSVEVHLRHSAEGLSARVLAQPEAAHLLQQAAGELRRSLEQQGLTIVQIDIATADDDTAGNAAGNGAAGQERRDGGRRPGEPGGHTAELDAPVVDHTIELPNGALVDVLA
jgi:hypothetical protein